ncbi:MAG TPA: ABC transporter permease [Terriglobales bacterium]|jgi:predicted permease|nr:ABC transporter permease [Terriglobales bacterium]
MTMPFWRRYARFFGPNTTADITEELEFHLDAKTDDLIRQGWAPEAARQEAERKFGDRRAVQRIGEQIGQKVERRRRRSDYLIDALQDVRYTFRTLSRDPGFASISLLILALAIGANIAVFSVVNTILLRALPFPHSNELVWIAPPPSECGWSCATYSADAYEEFRSESRVYQDVTGYEAFTTPENFRLTGRGEPVPATGMEVIGNFFQVLGVEPAIGRLFTLEESRSGAVVPNSTAQPFALLANAYWRRQFHSDPTIVGRAIELNGAPVTVVGVLPQSFDYGAVFSPGAKADLFVPVSLDKERMWGNIVTLVGRLKPGVTEAQALDDANRVAPDIYFNVKYPESRGRYKGNLVPIPLKDYVTGKLRRSLIALWFAVGTILLIAGVNLSNLLLARAAARAKEFAVRGALGAGRGRIVRQLLMESFVLSGAGALLGLGLAVVVIRWLAHQGSLALPLLSSLRIDNQALAWTLLVTVLTATVFGLLPGLRIARGNLQEVLKDSGAGAGLGRKHERIRAALVVSEIALACVLLVSAGLLLRSFSKVLEVDLGFQPDHAWSINVEYDDSAPSQEASVLKRSVAFQQIVARVGAIPGVQAVGISDYLPLGPNRSWDTPVPKGRLFAPGELPEPLVYVITPGFIRAMGMRLQGRDFTWSDGPKSERVIIINSSMARRFWPGEDPIGKILMRGDEQDHVVGVVDDVHEESVETSVGAQVYYPSTQQGPSRAQLVVRSNLSPELLAPNVLRGLRELNPNQSAAEFRPIRTIVDHAVSPRRFFMLLVTAFAGLGLLLATLGIYGVISYTVTRQTPEIGVRMALGATGGRVQRQVLANTLRLTATGIALGSVIAIAVARAIASLLFATSPWDLPSYLGMATALLLVALASGYVPARRASSINPMDALRSN